MESLRAQEEAEAGTWGCPALAEWPGLCGVPRARPTVSCDVVERGVTAFEGDATQHSVIGTSIGRRSELPNTKQSQAAEIRDYFKFLCRCMLCSRPCLCQVSRVKGVPCTFPHMTPLKLHMSGVTFSPPVNTVLTSIDESSSEAS